ncbi:MAG: 2,3-bisphosphoglycerate-dependent phosphoglycerate mutase [Rhabdochlamydiaceae bacterium]
MTQAQLILLRHGQSEWNKRNLFTGCVDVPLSLEGIEEAKQAGIKMADLPIDRVFVSSLIRSQMTATIALAYHKQGKVPYFIHDEPPMSEWSKMHNDGQSDSMLPVEISPYLNERGYGKLQGLNKKETMDLFGEEQVRLWRRSYDVAPPSGESLAMTYERTVPYFQSRVEKHLKDGKTVLVVAHGNSLRSIMMYILNISKEEIVNLEIATGVPLVYSYESGHYRQRS